jgi:hypothetical protein
LAVDENGAMHAIGFIAAAEPDALTGKVVWVGYDVAERRAVRFAWTYVRLTRRFLGDLPK